MNTNIDVPLTPFRYPHFDHSQLMIDLRTQPKATILSAHCYFVGFRVSVVSGYDYYHALILAEDYEALNKGIEMERDQILAYYPHLYSMDIAPVYIRTMNSEDASLLSDEGRTLISDHLKQVLKKRDDHQFVILGLKGEQNMSCVELQSADAWTAMRSLKQQLSRIDSDQFKPLQVCQAHPVTSEFVTLFHQVAKRFAMLSEFESAGVMH